MSVKLIFSITLIVILVASTYGFYHIQTQRKRLLDTMIQGADQLSKGITSATWHAMLVDRRSAAYEIMSKIAEQQGINRIRMFNREGRVMYSTRGQEDYVPANKTAEVCLPCHAGSKRAAGLTIHSRTRIVAEPGGRRTLSMVTPIYNERACSQAACHAHPASVKVLGVLDVSLLLDPVEQEEANIRDQIAVTILVEVIVMALFLIFFVRRFVVRPIGELIVGTKAVSAMELDHTIEVRHRSVELDALVDSFNRMKERLRAALDEVNQFTQQLETKVAQRTEQLKLAQQKLMQGDRLASLGQLSASVAHEINNPVAGILNLSMLMQRITKGGTIPAGREEEFRKYLSQVVSETARVGRIVSDLLAFSRRSKPQHVPVELNKLVERTLSLIQHKLRLADVTAELRLQPDLPPLMGDPSQLQQVILNLLLNAADATGKSGGSIRVVTRMATDGGSVEMEVADKGEGILPENMNRIFDPFFTTKSERKGVGLGLAVLYGIVQAHDGDVEVFSAPGAGSRFVVKLPLAGGVHGNGSETLPAPMTS